MSRLTVIGTERAASPAAAYSQGVRTDSLVFTAGQVGAAPAGALGHTIREQTELSIDNLSAVLEEAGSSMSQVVKTTCYLANVEDFAEFDRVYRGRFGEQLPARSTVVVDFGNPEILVEIEAIAVR